MIHVSPAPPISLMSNLLTADIIAALRPHSDRDLIITVGNSFRSDDGVGPYIASCLKTVSKAKIIDAGYTPENIIDDVIALAPKYIIIVDAANFGGHPGEGRIISEESIPETTLSTHSIPLNVIASIIKESTKAEILFIGIQPKTVMLGEGLTKEVKDSADKIIATINSTY